MGPIVCLITDRSRLGSGGGQATIARVSAAARAGVHLVMVRERDLEAGPLTALVAGCVEAVHGTRARVVVNERLDVALAAGAHGVHLRGDSIPAARARTIVPPAFLIGRSVHAVSEAMSAADAGGLDYLLFGTVFETLSKPGRSAAGAALLTGVVAATRVPVLGVGGMTLATLPGLGRTGAAGFAGIGLFAELPVGQLKMVVQQACLAFDTPSSVP